MDVLPPDVNESERGFSVVGEAIRFGFAGIKNVGEGAIEAILEVREHGRGPFQSLFDFADRIDGRRVNRRVVESLVKCGAFDSLHENRAAVWNSLAAALERGAAAQRDRAIGQESLFEALGPANRGASLELSETARWTTSEQLHHERELLGFYVTGHPLRAAAPELARYTDTTAGTAVGKEGREIRTGGLISMLRETRTRRGQRMAFATLEDLEGSFELVIFAEPYTRHGPLLRAAAESRNGDVVPVVVSGTLEAGEPAKILVRDVLRLADAQQRLSAQFRVRVLEPDVTRDRMIALRRALESHPGDCAVYLHITIPGESETVMSLSGSRGVEVSDVLERDVNALFGRPVTEHSP